jgi:hypothetical protein
MASRTNRAAPAARDRAARTAAASRDQPGSSGRTGRTRPGRTQGGTRSSGSEARRSAPARSASARSASARPDRKDGTKSPRSAPGAPADRQVSNRSRAGTAQRGTARGRKDRDGFDGRQAQRRVPRGRQERDDHRGGTRGRRDRDAPRREDERRDGDRQSPRLPSVPASVTADQLDPAARAELRTLPSDLAESVARFLVAAATARDPDRGYDYALAARRLAARVGIVRETCGIAAYRAGKWADALAELRAARRLTGQDSYLPLMADCERALGRPDRALDLLTSPEARNLSRETQVEMRIVESGIRRDQGFPEAAVVALQIPELTDGRDRPGSARLYYAYADALTDAGRELDARYWFAKAAAADVASETDAAERADDLDMLAFDDLEADGADELDLDHDVGPDADGGTRDGQRPARS